MCCRVSVGLVLGQYMAVGYHKDWPVGLVLGQKCTYCSVSVGLVLAHWWTVSYS